MAQWIAAGGLEFDSRAGRHMNVCLESGYICKYVCKFCMASVIGEVLVGALSVKALFIA